MWKDSDKLVEKSGSVGGFFSAQGKTHKRTAAVSEHDGNAKRNDCQRKHRGIGSIAVGTEIACVGNENLIHDVVKGADQKGNDARNGIFPHQLSELFVGKGVLLFFHKETSCK